MVRQKTLIVLGAGASTEVGLPTGGGLKPEIARLLNIRFDVGRQLSGDYEILEALRIWTKASKDGSDVNPMLLACWRIRDAMPQALSIDNYIDAHNGDNRIEACGKLAIARSILAAEQKSSLYINSTSKSRTLDFEKLQDNWLNRFFQILTENCRVDDLEQRLLSLALVIFNYDRCFEHFLYHSLQNYYGLDEKRAARLVDGMEIYHPYGKVGNLPWQSGGNAFEFGSDISPHKLLDVSTQIRTFAEGTDPNASEIESIRRRIAESSILVFLGFAFHKLNMELLGSEQAAFEPKSSFSTAKGISNHDCSLIEREIARLCNDALKDNFVRNDLTCCGLFDEYWRSLALT